MGRIGALVWERGPGGVLIAPPRLSGRLISKPPPCMAVRVSSWAPPRCVRATWASPLVSVGSCCALPQRGLHGGERVEEGNIHLGR